MKNLVSRLRAASGNAESSDKDFAAALLKSVSRLESYRSVRKVLKLKRNATAAEVIRELEIQAKEDVVFDRKWNLHHLCKQKQNQTSFLESPMVL